MSRRPARLSCVPTWGRAFRSSPSSSPRSRRRLPDLAAPIELAPSASRVRAYEALSRLLLDAAAGSSLVLVLDDLQWADAASLDLLGYAGRALRAAPVLLLGSFRQTVGLDHPLAAALADLDRQLPVRRLRLAPLAPAETGSLVAAILGQTPSAAAVEAIHRDTGGNPFFAAELTRHLLEEGHDLASGSLDLSPAVPDSVRDAIGRRLSRLSGETVRLLSLACCFGGPFEFGELQSLSDLAEEPLLDAIDEALAAGMIATAGGERYVFAHSLVRQTLYDELSPSRRARLHRRAAQALELAHPGQEMAHAAELARQYERSRSLPGAASGSATRSPRQSRHGRAPRTSRRSPICAQRGSLRSRATRPFARRCSRGWRSLRPRRCKSARPTRRSQRRSTA